MQILLEIDELWDVIDDIENPETEKKAKDVMGLDEKDKLEVVNIGPGADVLVFLITIVSTTLTIWSIPTIIRTGSKDWKWLIKRLKGFIKKKQLVSLDQDAATLLAIDYLAEKYGEENVLSFMDAHTFNIVDISGMFPGEEDSFAAHPHNYYVFTFHVDASKVVLSVRSTGEIRILEIFDDMPYGLTDYKD